MGSVLLALETCVLTGGSNHNTLLPLDLIREARAIMRLPKPSRPQGHRKDTSEQATPQSSPWLLWGHQDQRVLHKPSLASLARPSTLQGPLTCCQGN